MNRKKIIKILIPLIIIIIIIAIYFIKNSDDSESANSLDITSINLEEYKSYSLPIIIDFGSDSCIPCKNMYPILVTFNNEMQGKAIIHFIDVWKYKDAIGDFPIQVIPTQVFYAEDGDPYIPSDKIQDEITFILYDNFTIHEGSLTEEEMRSILSDMGVK